MSRELEGAMVSLPNALPQCSTGEGSLIGELASCTLHGIDMPASNRCSACESRCRACHMHAADKMTNCDSGNAIQFTTMHNTVCSVVQPSQITHHACTKGRHAQRPYQFQHCIGCFTTAVQKRAMSSCAMEITVSPIQPASQQEDGPSRRRQSSGSLCRQLGMHSNPRARGRCYW